MELLFIYFKTMTTSMKNIFSVKIICNVTYEYITLGKKI